MKILHVVHGYTPSRGGSQWFAQQLAERTVRDYGNETTVFTTVADNLEYFWRRDLPSLPPGTEAINGVFVRRFPVFNHLRWTRVAAASLFYRLRLPGNDWLRTLQTGPIIPGLANAIVKSDADVVVAQSFPLLHMYTALNAAKKSGKPIVMIGALHPEDSWGFERRSIYRAIAQADAYIALTPFERDFVIGRNADPSKIHLIAPGVDLTPYETVDAAAWRSRFGFGDEPIVFALGKFVARKRYDLLIKAMRGVWKIRPKARLVLAGGYTDYLEELQQFVGTLPVLLQHQITILTNISDEEKTGLLHTCDLFVLASIEESFGIAFVEAWAAGKPVIGANAGAIASLIQPGETGLLFDPHSAQHLAQQIVSLLDDPVAIARIGAAGRALVERDYTWDRCVGRFNALYIDLVSAKLA